MAQARKIKAPKTIINKKIVFFLCFPAFRNETEFKDFMQRILKENEKIKPTKAGIKNCKLVNKKLKLMINTVTYKERGVYAYYVYKNDFRNVANLKSAHIQQIRKSHENLPNEYSQYEFKLKVITLTFPKNEEEFKKVQEVISSLTSIDDLYLDSHGNADFLHNAFIRQTADVLAFNLNALGLTTNIPPLIYVWGCNTAYMVDDDPSCTEKLRSALIKLNFQHVVTIGPTGYLFGVRDAVYCTFVKPLQEGETFAELNKPSVSVFRTPIKNKYQQVSEEDTKIYTPLVLAGLSRYLDSITATSSLEISNNNNVVTSPLETSNNNNVVTSPLETSNNNNVVTLPTETSNNNNLVTTSPETSNNNNVATSPQVQITSTLVPKKLFAPKNQPQMPSHRYPTSSSLKKIESAKEESDDSKLKRNKKR